jgi:hypothetical protein
MTTGNMPNPPDQPTTQVVPPDSTTATQGEATPEQGEAPPLSLHADMARIIEAQADVIAQKQLYHSQILLGVSALGTDVVNARQSAIMVAHALRNSDTASATHTLVNLGDPQFSQVNDRTLPYRFNSQMAGLLQGIIIDEITQAYRDDPGKANEAKAILSTLFESADEAVMKLPKYPPRFQAPAFSPEPLSLSAPEAE